KQYRKAVEKELLEIPAGKLEIGEEPRETAIRELKEETGFSSAKIEYITEFYTSAGFTNEKMHLFLATELTEGAAEPEKDEYIEVIKLDLETLIDKVLKGEI
ncbi:ADP-ribose pyrophosphatase, partial [Methanolobus chelungpuianus]